MQERSESTPDVERFGPTRNEPESRDETVARAIADDPAGTAREEVAEDPSARRGFLRTLIVRPHGWSLIGAALGAVIGLLIALNATPVEAPFTGGDRGAIGTTFGTLGYILLLALVFSLVFLAISGLIYSAREDGRTERRVEEETGTNPGAPARPLDHGHDV